jgi:hypothetical protein
MIGDLPRVIGKVTLFLMSLAEMLDQIPKLSFAERQELIRCAIEVDDAGLSSEEEAILAKRLQDFHPDEKSGIPLEDLSGKVQKNLRSR